MDNQKTTQPIRKPKLTYEVCDFCMKMKSSEVIYDYDDEKFCETCMNSDEFQEIQRQRAIQFNLPLEYEEVPDFVEQTYTHDIYETDEEENEEEDEEEQECK